MKNAYVILTIGSFLMMSISASEPLRHETIVLYSDGEPFTEESALNDLAKGDMLGAGKLYAIAQGYFLRNQPKALSLLHILTEQQVNPFTRARAFLRLGDVYNSGLLGEKRDAQKAIKYYLSSLKDGSWDISLNALDALANIYKAGNGVKKDLDKAEYYLRQRLQVIPAELTPLRVAALFELARIAQSKNNMEDALKLFRYVVGQNLVYSAEASLAIADILKDQGKLAEAVEYYKKAADQGVEPNPRDTAATELAFLLFKGGPGLAKDIPGSQKYALQVLQETQFPKKAEGMRALLRLSGYKGQIPMVKP